MSDAALLQIAFEAEVIEWRGPAPFFFAAVPDAFSDAIRDAARVASYGWGVVPVTATMGAVTFSTSLFPRAGTYLLPLKDKVRREVGAVLGDIVAVRMAIAPAQFSSPRA